MKFLRTKGNFWRIDNFPFLPLGLTWVQRAVNGTSLVSDQIPLIGALPKKLPTTTNDPFDDAPIRVPMHSPLA
jgi:hypothetical protein